MPAHLPPMGLDDLHRFAVPADPALRPDGGAVAYTLTTTDVAADENRTEIWLAAPGAEPRRLAQGSAPRWSPDGRTLAFLRPVDGRPQLHLLPMDGGEPYVVTDAPLGAGPARWSPDGTRIAYAGPAGPAPDLDAPVVVRRLDYKADGSGLLRGVTTHLFVVDVASGESVQVTEGDFHAGEPSWSPDGTRLAFVTDLDADRDLRPGGAAYSVTLPHLAGGGELERLSGPELLVGGVWWLGGRLVAAALKGGPVGHVRLYALGPGGAAEIEIGLDRNVMTGHPGYPGASPALLGDDLVFCARDGGHTHLYRIRGDELAAKIVPEDAGVAGVSTAAGRVAYVAATPRSAGDVYLLEPGATTARRLTDHAPAGVDLYVPERRTFTAPDGTEIEGFVWRDANATTPGPLLLDVHGGPHNAWAPVLDAFRVYRQVLAARGWTVLAINPRGSDGYGEAFYTAAVGAWGLADTQDFLAAVDALVAEGVADPHRLAVTGYSYGGYMTCWLTGVTGRFKAAVAGGAVTDLTSMSGTSDMGLALKAYECPGDLAAQSPLTHVGEVTAPTLLLHGESDDRCPVGQSEQWFAALRERRVPVELVRYPGAGHLFQGGGRPSHRYDYNERMIAWLEQWAGGSRS
ncbi:alpha/beta hydrolase family protein [[Actinomadura] parvosata]|uniref:S9 family peptidase n=1 Tax=[Actinomadura] parvosata TaxID=1955412 RepID=UPI001E4199E0|nr:S9 family peptidase [Nonomuraea sp. ATCC 55076]